MRAVNGQTAVLYRAGVGKHAYAVVAGLDITVESPPRAVPQSPVDQRAASTLGDQPQRFTRPLNGAAGEHAAGP
jgi:hypothetical protein